MAAIVDLTCTAWHKLARLAALAVVLGACTAARAPAAGSSDAGQSAQRDGSTPTTCGNGRLDDGEPCDGELVRNRACWSVGWGGDDLVTCDGACHLDISQCFDAAGSESTDGSVAAAPDLDASVSDHDASPDADGGR